MLILTPQEMYQCDQETCIKEKITSLELMERAGKKLSELICSECDLYKDSDVILTICGTGNNGGDGLIITKNLFEQGFNVSVVMVGENQNEQVRTVLKTLVQKQINIFFVNQDEDLTQYTELVNQSTFIIDGIFGIGLTREIKGIYFKVIDIINQSHKSVFSIDIPSGINGNNGLVNKIAVRADFTGIVQNYKTGNLLNDGSDYQGKQTVVDIGIINDNITSNRLLLGENNIKGLIKKRKNNTYKYNYGSVLTIGGCIGMTGAPLMCSYSALRSGVGLSTIGINQGYLPYLHNIYPEIMVKPYTNLKDIENLLYKKDVIAFGPGLGRLDKVNYDILKLLIDSKIPLVIDADGIFYLRGLLNEIKDGSNIIITPHCGEMGMLLDIDTISVISSPLEMIQYLVNTYNFNVVLKGTCTIVANSKEIYFSNNGNPGMATAGSGDVLTGIIASLVGRGLSLINACKLGVYIHSLAGSFALKEFGENSLIATDIIRYLPNAFCKVMSI